ncbi:hypothetical protein G210_4361 [Candida maltosa Xu316]|uniref:Uncharacterized protein n=1 Tax=Candida maltosa (strain Xu316) TaxID=1245528 RepID=M3HDZ6_CANMX|nr:hypothetical protein G210_4361 [Candida maltosa Xu316]
MAYTVVNQQMVRSGSSKYDSNMSFLENNLKDLKVPIFIKDLIREMARPMITPKKDIYLPDVPSVSGKQWLKKIQNYYDLISELMFDTNLKNLKWCNLDIEEIEPSEFAMYHDEKTLLSSFVDLPRFRFLALAVLKHIRFKQYRLVHNEVKKDDGWIDLDTGTNEPLVKIGDVQQIFQNTDLIRGFCVYRNNGRVTINSQSLMGHKIDLRDFHLEFDGRFPTEKKFLLTNRKSDARKHMKKVIKPRKLKKRTISIEV